MAALVSIAALLACTAELPTPSTDRGAPYFVDLETAKTVAVAKDQSILLDFYTDWWRYCKQMDTVVFVDQKAVDLFSNKIVFARLNAERDSIVTNEDGTADTTVVKTKVSLDYNVSGYPTYVLVDKDGQEIDRIIGYVDVDDLIKTLANYEKGIGTLDDLVAKAEGSDNRDLFYEIGDKYKYRGAPEEAERYYRKVIEAGDAKDSLSGQSRLALADMNRRAKKYDEAIADYTIIADEFQGNATGEEAQIYVGYINMKYVDSAKALKAFETFLKDYPESEETEWVSEQIKNLKDTTSEK